MPLQYNSILEEHRAVRTGVGLFDVSHMGELSIHGREAIDLLDWLVPTPVTPLAQGKAMYTCFCNPEGGIIDDLIIYRLEKDAFFLCVNASNCAKVLDWVTLHSATFDCKVEDVSARYALLALQGPLAAKTLQAVTKTKVQELERFSVVQTKAAHCSVILSRTGYTGEDGFELYCASEEGIAVAEALQAAGKPQGLKLCGLGARDSLRLEAGLPLHGHEIGVDISPFEGGLSWLVKLSKKGDFVGREALKNEKKVGPQRQLIHFILEDRRIARQGAAVLFEEKEVGKVVSGTLSPLMNRGIGSALIERKLVPKGAELYVLLRGKRLVLQVQKPPLHR